MATKPEKEVASGERIVSAKSHIQLITSGQMTTQKQLTSIFTIPVATRLDKMVAYGKESLTS